MNALQLFHNDKFGNIRTTTINGEPWFVGKDIADALGYANSSKAVMMHVDDEDKTFLMCDFKADSQNGSPLGQTKTTFINESGVYSLILRSNLPTAREFKRWVTSEILPSIRKTGFYATPVTVDDIIRDPGTFIKILQQMQEDRKRIDSLEETTAFQGQQIAEMNPKATYYDLVLNCPDLVPISLIAKDFGLSARLLNNILADQHVQYKQGKTWLLYQKYAEKGYTQSKTYTYEDNKKVSHSKMHTLWTQKGRLFVYDLLKTIGYLPNIERENNHCDS